MEYSNKWKIVRGTAVVFIVDDCDDEIVYPDTILVSEMSIPKDAKFKSNIEDCVTWTADGCNWHIADDEFEACKFIKNIYEEEEAPISKSFLAKYMAEFVIHYLGKEGYLDDSCYFGKGYDDSDVRLNFDIMSDIIIDGFYKTMPGKQDWFYFSTEKES